MRSLIDHEARKQLAALARRLAAGAITNYQFENECPDSKEYAIHDIFFYGLWPFYDDLFEHKLVGKWALSREGRTWVARIVLFLHSGLAYRYPRRTGFSQVPVMLLSLATLGWFGRFWRRRLWRGGDKSIWPFYSRSEYEAALQNPMFMGSQGHDI